MTDPSLEKERERLKFMLSGRYKNDDDEVFNMGGPNHFGEWHTSAQCKLVAALEQLEQAREGGDMSEVKSTEDLLEETLLILLDLAAEKHVSGIASDANLLYKHCKDSAATIRALRTQLAQRGEVEAIGWLTRDGLFTKIPVTACIETGLWTPVYTHPPALRLPDRDEIIWALLATRGQSEGVAADAIIHLIKSAQVE